MELNPISSPANSPLQMVWQLGDIKARLFDIVLHLGDANIEAIRPHEIAKAVWTALKSKYEHLDKVYVVILRWTISKIDNERRQICDVILGEFLKC